MPASCHHSLAEITPEYVCRNTATVLEVNLCKIAQTIHLKTVETHQVGFVRSLLALSHTALLWSKSKEHLRMMSSFRDTAGLGGKWKEVK